MNLGNKLNIPLLIIAFLNASLIIFLIYPLWSDIVMASQDLKNQIESLVVFDAEIKNIEVFRNLYPGIRPNLEKASDLLVIYEAPVEFMKFLEAVSDDCQLSTTVMASAIVQNKEKTSWPLLSFQITSLGSAPDFYKFLDKIESGPYLIEIQNLKINRLTEKELEQKEFVGLFLGDVKAVISVNLFTKKQ